VTIVGIALDRDERGAKVQQECEADDRDDDEFLDQLFLQVRDRAPSGHLAPPVSLLLGRCSP